MDELKYGAYGFGKEVNLAFTEAVARTKAALKEQGFGVLTEIDMKQTLKEKRGIDFRNYAILGACNPPLAEKALGAELEIGLLLPCNVIVYEQGESSVVKAMDPETALGIVNNPALLEVAGEAKSRLQKALASLPGTV
ncbi:MAG: DUF302 domain-containing protein [Chloroflexi bacterium]|nr:DUF302 domain-containing protein [Chloroflexota bacterium]OJV90037.1 MAG: ABC transporter ATP-binding protein [Chloroflexi bacterium 54-19]